MDKALLVSVVLQTEDPTEVDESLDELKDLVGTCGYGVEHTLIQRRKKYDSATFVGQGKLQELHDKVEEHQVHVVVFDQELSPAQLKNIETVCKVMVLDRTDIILQIFERHAKTKEAKTQVEIARIEYMLPRLTRKWLHLERQRGAKGGLYGRGMGEKQIEVDRRILRDRMAKLKKDLKTIKKERFIQRKTRNSILKVALVGYTNVGKTQIMNGLTHSGFVSDNNLFVTLDPKIRVLDPRTRPKILVSDTVGFIKKIPHSLVEAFKSTLEEVCFADLILHVVDISHPGYEHQVEITDEVLQEIGASEIDTIYVFNKTDLLPFNERFLPKVVTRGNRDSFSLSALDMNNIKSLRDHIFQFFERDMVSFVVKFSYDQGEGIAYVQKVCKVVSSKAHDSEIEFTAKTTLDNVVKIRQFGGDLKITSEVPEEFNNL